MEKEYRGITVSQIEKMQRAVGFKKNRVTGIKNRVMHCYRNYYMSTRKPDEEWEALIRLDLAYRTESVHTPGTVWYHLSEEGAAFIAELCGFERLVVEENPTSSNEDSNKVEQEVRYEIGG